MASFVLKNPWIWLNAFDLSASGTTLRINVNADIQENTAFGSSVVTRVGGLMSWDATFDFNHDTSGSPITMLYIAKEAGNAIAFRAKNDNSGTSSTNPCYGGNCIITALNPLSGTIGDLHRGTVTLKGTGALTRYTA